MSANSITRITWLGHATFLLTAPSGTTLLVDPFVDSNPSCPDRFKAFERLDCVAITHGHEDHVADAVAICQRYKPMTAAMVEVAAWLQDRGVPENHLVPMNKGGTVQLNDIGVTMVHAQHSNSLPGTGGSAYGGEAAGLVFSFADGTRVYHAGDTNAFGDMRLIAELYAPTIALLPIGDRFTMGPGEAALACEFLKVPRVVPMHYGTWPILTGTPDALAAECLARGLEIEVVALNPGDTLA
jgi:L-ascorbate metabolism protein UlaG (beta-lactamase superfamily)